VLTAEELKAIAERVERATPGPWAEEYQNEIPDDVRVCRRGLADDDTIGCIGCLALMGDYNEEEAEWTPETIMQWRADANFIAHARADIPALLAHIAELEEVKRKAIIQSEYIQSHGLTEYEMTILKARVTELEDDAKLGKRVREMPLAVELLHDRASGSHSWVVAYTPPGFDTGYVYGAGESIIDALEQAMLVLPQVIEIWQDHGADNTTEAALEAARKEET
jgi:hypothetical protein